MTTRTLTARAALAGLPLALLLALASCGGHAPKSETAPATTPTAPAAADLFEDVTVRSAALQKFQFRNGEDRGLFAILEATGGGVGVIDYDQDGHWDLVVAGGGDFVGGKKPLGYPTRIFRNVGDFHFVDVTEEVLPEKTQALFYSQGIAVCDYDRDGWPDLLITGYGGVALYRNAPDGKGGRKFVDVTEQAGLKLPVDFWATSAAFADLDGDGWPDLYICRYVDWTPDNNPVCPGYREGVKQDTCTPRQFNARQHAVFRNTGLGGFVNVSDAPETGLRTECKDPDKCKEKRSYCGKGLGVLILNVHEDGKPDVYVANDTTGNFLYLNMSSPGQIRLKEVGQEFGVALDLNQQPMGSMGVDAADIDNSGQPSLWVTNYEGEQYSLYRMAPGAAKKLFFHSTAAAGLAAIGQMFVGWGTGFLDLDNDGWQDLVVTNGHTARFPPHYNLAQRPVLFRNKGDGQGRFAIITEQGGPYFGKAHRGRGLAVVDLDNDGRPDLVVTHVNEPPALLRNICDSGHHWLGVTLAGRDRADVVGARAVLELPGRKLTQFQKGGGSYLSARDPRLLFGLGKDAAAGRLMVHWPGGAPRVEYWDGLAIDRYHTIVQGQGNKT